MKPTVLLALLGRLGSFRPPAFPPRDDFDESVSIDPDPVPSEGPVRGENDDLAVVGDVGSGGMSSVSVGAARSPFLVVPLALVLKSRFAFGAEATRRMNREAAEPGDFGLGELGEGSCGGLLWRGEAVMYGE